MLLICRVGTAVIHLLTTPSRPHHHTATTLFNCKWSFVLLLLSSPASRRWKKHFPLSLPFRLPSKISSGLLEDKFPLSAAPSSTYNVHWKAQVRRAETWKAYEQNNYEAEIPSGLQICNLIMYICYIFRRIFFVWRHTTKPQRFCHVYQCIPSIHPSFFAIFNIGQRKKGESAHTQS